MEVDTVEAAVAETAKTAVAEVVEVETVAVLEVHKVDNDSDGCHSNRSSGEGHDEREDGADD